MTGILTDDENLAMASDDLAFVAHFLDRRAYLHICLPFGLCGYFDVYSRPAAGDNHQRGFTHIHNKSDLFITISDTPSVQIVNRKLDRHFVSRQDFDVVHTHLAGYVG